MLFVCILHVDKYTRCNVRCQHIPLPLPQQGTLFIPGMNDQGFQAILVVNFYAQAAHRGDSPDHRWRRCPVQTGVGLLSYVQWHGKQVVNCLSTLLRLVWGRGRLSARDTMRPTNPSASKTWGEHQAPFGGPETHSMGTDIVRELDCLRQKN